jgi:hypothetical protein
VCVLSLSLRAGSAAISYLQGFSPGDVGWRGVQTAGASGQHGGDEDMDAGAARANVDQVRRNARAPPA